MTEDVFKTKLSEARDQIMQLPEDKQGPLMALLNETQTRHDEMKNSFSKIHDTLAEWQLMMKYLVFDREATRRERDALRRQLEDRNS